MAEVYKAKPSEIVRVDDPFEAWCLDQAIAIYTARIRRKDKLRPPVTDNNDALLAKLLKDKKE
jgi:hypothetical protein